jgi:hypothetical protein
MVLCKNRADIRLKVASMSYAEGRAAASAGCAVECAPGTRRYREAWGSAAWADATGCLKAVTAGGGRSEVRFAVPAQKKWPG